CGQQRGDAEAADATATIPQSSDKPVVAASLQQHPESRTPKPKSLSSSAANGCAALFTKPADLPWRRVAKSSKHSAIKFLRATNWSRLFAYQMREPSPAYAR